MEIGEYLTNVVSTDDFASLRYIYLECQQADLDTSRTGILHVVDNWRQLGSLVIEDNTSPGIWLFGNVKNTGSLLPDSVKPDSDGIIRLQGINLIVKEDETYTYDLSKALQASKQNTAALKENGGTPVSSSPSNDSSRISSPVSLKPPQNNQVSAGNVPGSTSNLRAEHPIFAQRRKMKEYLIAAVLAALSYRLCYDNGCIALNARTLILPIAKGVWKNENRMKATTGDSIFGNTISLLTIDINLTAMGTLVLKAALSTSSFLSALVSSGSEVGLLQGSVGVKNVLLAPTGKVGRYISATGEQNANNDALDAADQLKRTRIAEYLALAQPSDEWKHRCLSWLAQRGIKSDDLDSRKWLMVQMWISRQKTSSIKDEDAAVTDRQKVTIFWPEKLCFSQTNTPAELDVQTTPDIQGSYDPLEFAQGWYMSRNEREVAIGKRKKEREATEAAAKAQADLEAKSVPAISYSPVALRRASGAGMVYPTPPDALPPTLGATPSFDGNVSTPGQPGHQLANVDMEITNVVKGEPDLDGKTWDSATVKPEPTTSGLEFNDSGNENLFGDIGEDLFGENNITDADFSFFDEPDDFQGSQEDVNMDEPSLDDAKKTSTDDKSADNQVISVLQDSNRSPDVEMGDTEISTELPPSTKDVLDPAGNVDSAELAFTESNLDGQPSDSAEPTERNMKPPLSPELVFKRLSVNGSFRPSPLKSTTHNVTPHVDDFAGAFRGFDFDSSLLSSDEKYGTHGRFNSPLRQKAMLNSKSLELPNTGYLRRRQRKSSNAQDFLTQALFSPSDKTIVQSPPDSSQSEFEVADGSNIASPSSNRDDTSNTSDENQVIFTAGSKRKRGEESIDDQRGHDQIMTPFQDLNVDEDSLQLPIPSESLNPCLLNPDLADWSLAKFLQAPSLRPVPNALSDEEYVAAAQLLADQATPRTLLAPGLATYEASSTKGRHFDGDSALEFAQQSLFKASKHYFAAVTPRTLNSFLEIPGASTLSQARLPPRPTPMPRNPHGADPFSNNGIFTLPAPHLQVRRGDSKLTVLPPAIPFWDSLGLAPCGDSKDVSALCIYPDSEGMADNADSFLEQMRSAYESNRLGLHDRLSGSSISDGLVPVDLSKAKPHLALDQGLSTIKDTAVHVGATLASSLLEDRNFVVYCIYDSMRPELLIYTCSAFYHLLEAYKEALADKKQEPSNEIVLQLVPMEFLASRTSLIIPPPSEYARLAIEVYDRCIQMETGEFTPSIVLEQPLPRTIDFRLTTTPSQSLLHENSCMHVAYAQSIDDHWITAAWTDNSGRQQMTASYCLGRKETPLTRAFADVAHEIWETTREAISTRKVNWRIFIVKCGVMEVAEMDFWKGLAATESNAQISLTLLMVDTQPSLQLLPPAISFPPASLSAQSIFYTTPVSTPQSSSIVSPEQSGNATTPARDGAGGNSATPGGDSNAELKVEPDATLVNVTDESWGAILSHRNNNSNSLLEFVATLQSGYLIKRTGSMPSEVPVVMEVNILHSELNPRVYEGLLKEILGYYRGLATLARARGVVDPAKDTRPWHIAAAEKGVRALYILM